MIFFSTLDLLSLHILMFVYFHVQTLKAPQALKLMIWILNLREY